MATRRPQKLLSLLATALTPLALALGCSQDGAGQAAGAGALGQSSEAVTVCAGGSVVEGVDVSVYQGTVDWSQVAASGRGFAIARVSDGTTTPDPTFSTNWAGIKAAGMVRGVYQFFRASEDPTAQANLLLSAIGSLGDDDLPPVADVEVMDGESGATLVANLATWVSVIRAGTGRAPIIYAAPGFWDPLPSTGQFSSDVLWVANWGVNCPDTPTPWTGWSMWQYADNGSVPGISGAVDLDRFNGTSAALLQTAGGTPDYAAAFVSQSFPLATTALQMTEEQTIPSYIELKNVGSKTWDSSTHLGTTQPRDRTSVFADSSWLAPDRPAGVTGTVAPGSTYKFTFNLHAPEQTGTFDEYFGVVQEGVAWFSDPGQGGPPDNDLEVQVKVIAPQYQGTFVSQSYPLAPAVFNMTVGQDVQGWIELTNTGTESWISGTTKLAPIPRDQASSFADASWLSPSRVSTVPSNVAPGSNGRFPLSLQATQAGDFEVLFGLVEETVTWFADAPLGGGPADGFLRVHVHVTAATSADASVPSESDSGADAAATGDDADLGTDAAVQAPGDDAGTFGQGDAGLGTPVLVTPSADGGATGTRRPVLDQPGHGSGGGGCQMGGPGDGAATPWLLFGVSLVLGAYRRRRAPASRAA